jgi:hypothetical protein
MAFSNQNVALLTIRLGGVVRDHCLEGLISESDSLAREDLGAAYVYEFLVYWLKCRYPNYC